MADIAVQQREQPLPFVKQLFRPIDFELDQPPIVLVAPAFADLILGHAEPLHRILREVDAVAVEDVAPHVLPEVGQLQRGAGAIRQPLALLVAVATHIQDEPADRIGAPAAVIDQLIEVIVTIDPLVLFERVDQIQERLNRDLMPPDRSGQCHEQWRLALTRVAGLGVFAEPGQIARREVFVRHLIAQDYAFVADVSFLKQAEDNGLTYKDQGIDKSGLQILRDHGYNWIRLRVFVDPANASTHLPNDLQYAIALAKRAKAMGFKVVPQVSESLRKVQNL